MKQIPNTIIITSALPFLLTVWFLVTFNKNSGDPFEQIGKNLLFVIIYLFTAFTAGACAGTDYRKIWHLLVPTALAVIYMAAIILFTDMADLWPVVIGAPVFGTGIGFVVRMSVRTVRKMRERRSKA